MSTRSYICVAQDDGTIKGVYCHFDGYLTYNGALLLDNYSTRGNAQKIIDLGNVSILDERLFPSHTVPHEFGNREEGVSLFYGRDDGRDDQEAQRINLEELNKDGAIEFTYIHDGERWKYFEHSKLDEGLRDVEEDLNAYWRENGFDERPRGVYGDFLSSDFKRLKIELGMEEPAVSDNKKSNGYTVWEDKNGNQFTSVEVQKMAMGEMPIVNEKITKNPDETAKTESKLAPTSASQQKKSGWDRVKENRQELIDYIHGEISKGNLDWQHYLTGRAVPHNGDSGRQYHGLNRLYLALSAMKKGFEDPRWYTFNQVKNMGLSVEKGARGTRIEKFTIWDTKTKKEIHNRKEFDELTKGMSEDEKEAYKEENIKTYVNQHVVFNGQQVNGLEKYTFSKLNEDEKNECCEHVLEHSFVPIIYDANAIDAAYNRSSDSVILPSREKFVSMDDFYSTAFHEIAHATGAEKRLSRPIGLFGSNAYAIEEVTAELSSLFLQQDLGVDLRRDVVKNSAAYIQNWEQVLSKPEDFFHAVSAAEKATKYISEHSNAKENMTEAHKAETPKQNDINHVKKAINDNLAQEEAKERYMQSMREDFPNDFVEDLDDDVIEAQPKEMRQPLVIKSQVRDLPDWTTDKIKNEAAREAAEWLILNGFGNEKNVKDAFYDRQTSSMSDDFHAVENDEAAIIRVALAYNYKLPEKSSSDSNVQNKPHKPLVVNFYAGPGAGKTTAALELTAALKKAGDNVEYVSEYAKELVLEGKAEKLADQRLVTDEQFHRLDRLRGSVDMIVTDSPVLLGLVYGAGRIDDNYARQIKDYYNSFDNFNVFVNRGADYQQEGRIQNAAEAKILDGKIVEMLKANEVFYGRYSRGEGEIDKTVQRIETTYKRLNPNKTASFVKQVRQAENTKGKYGKFVEGATYYEIWSSESSESKVKSYFADYFQIVNGQVNKSTDFFGAISLENVYENIKLANEGKMLVELVEGEYQEIMNLRNSLQQAQKEQTDVAAQVQEVSALDYYEMQQEIEADLAYGAIDEADYTKEMERLKRTYKAVKEKNEERKDDDVKTNRKDNMSLRSAPAESKSEKLLSPREYYAQKNSKRLEEIERNVPAEMKALPNWCAFKTYYDKDNGKKKKIILSPETGQWGKCNDPATWTSYENAMDFARKNNCEGLSFALEPRTRIACVDLDHCINDNGMRSELCWNVLNASDGTYIEKSVSGHGVHVFFKADGIVDGYNKKDDAKGLECYDRSKFISVTGNTIGNTNDVKEAPKKLVELLHAELGKSAATSNTFAGFGSSRLSDSDLIEKIRSSKVGADFERMMNGEDICGDHSRTDAKLMSTLAFFSDCDPVQMKSVFKESGLYRPDKGEKYIDRTIDFVTSTLTTRPTHLGGKFAGRSAGHGGKTQAKDGGKGK